MKNPDTGHDRSKKSLADRLFPPRHDFYKMLQDQAEETVIAVNALVDWLKAGDLTEPQELIQIEQHADDIRHDMEHVLVESFSTPFDRQDIYSISRQMDYVINWSLSTALEMKAFKIKTDPAILEMAEALLRGVKLMSGAIRIMQSEPAKAESYVPRMRKAEREIDETYVRALARAFEEEDPRIPLKKREIYHHLRDAGRNLVATVDTLHRIIVGIL
jgi:uncharacterized protein Yka (UPF0111/DUF47 family)